MNEKLIKQIPNMFTISRIILVIISFIILLNNNYTLGIILLAIAALTDFFDGYFARKLNAKSDIGAKLDQLSDKLFSILICLALIILGNNYLMLTLFIELIFSIIVSIQSLKLNEWRESTKQGKIKITLIFVTILIGTLILKIQSLNILFITVWAITIIYQLYANFKIVFDIKKELKEKKNKKKKGNK